MDSNGISIRTGTDSIIVIEVIKVIYLNTQLG